MRIRYYAHAINEWVEISEDLYREWLGARAMLFQKEMTMQEAHGWVIERQHKVYGQVKITLTDTGLEVQLPENELGIGFTSGVSRILDVEPSRANADKLGFLFVQLFETYEKIKKVEADAGQVVIDAPRDWSREDLSPRRSRWDGDC